MTENFKWSKQRNVIRDDLAKIIFGTYFHYSTKYQKDRRDNKQVTERNSFSRLKLYHERNPAVRLNGFFQMYFKEEENESVNHTKALQRERKQRMNR